MSNDQNDHQPSAPWVVITDPDIVVPMPVLKYGYRTNKVSWEELQDILSQNDLARLSRSESQQHYYQVFQHHMAQQYLSSVDFLLISKFDIGAKKHNGMWKATKSLADIKQPMTRLVPNDFPYYVQENIRHFVFWKIKERITKEEIDQVKDLLCKDHGAVDILYWVNPTALQSLPEIEHVHFLFRTNPNSD